MVYKSVFVGSQCPAIAMMKNIDNNNDNNNNNINIKFKQI